MTIPASTNKQRDAGSLLALAAAPVFAAMAAISGKAAPALPLCGAAGLPIDAMTAMYALMSLFHLPAWLSPARRTDR